MRRPPAIHQTPTRNARRAGWSLIELLTVVTLIAVLSSSACVLIAKMLQTNQYQTEALIRQRALHLWQASFQQDGRQAQSARIEAATPETRRIEFQHPAGTVTYQVIPDGLERLVNGKPGGRWEFGRGLWEFTLLDQDRIVRAEFWRSIDLSGGFTGSSRSNSSQGVRKSPTCVEVALGSSVFLPMTQGAP